MFEFLQNLIIPRYKNNFHPYLLRKRSLAVITLVVLGVNILGSSVGGRVFAGAVSSSELITLANTERSAAGLGVLRTDPRLTAAAHAKAQNIFELQYWSHYGPNGETPWQFIIGSGYNYVFAGENLAKGFSSSEAAHSAWMASQTHRDNIMNPNYQDVGIAIVSGTLDGSEIVLVVQMFGALTENPAVSLPLTTIPEVQTSTSLFDSTELIVRIDYPESGSVLADNEFLMKGQASESIESVVITDNEDETEEIINEGGVWDYRPDEGWSEGGHIVTVSDETEIVSDIVDFEIDTVPPVINEESIQISRSQDAEGMVEIRVEADETANEAVLVSGGFSVSLSQTESGAFTAKVSIAELSSDENTVKIIVSDEVGNTSEVNITQGILGAVDEEGDSESSGFAGSVDISWWVTRGAVVLIAILLIVDIIFLFRLRIIHTRGKTLFPLAIWLIVLAVAMVVGTRGTIL